LKDEDATSIVVGTTVVTITSCSNDVCVTTSVTTGLTTVTDESTTFTTFCPLPTKSTKESSNGEGGGKETPKTREQEISTTTVTVTSCNENDVCNEYPVTTGVTTITDDFTTYTTYCPLPIITTTIAATTDGGFDDNGSEGAASDSSNEQIDTTTVTITTCQKDKCFTVPVVTGLTTVTKSNTVYTTYCPLPTTDTAIAEASQGESEPGTAKTEVVIETSVSVTKGEETIVVGATVTVTDEADETELTTVTIGGAGSGGAGEEMTTAANTVAPITTTSVAQEESPKSISSVQVSEQQQTVAVESSQSSSSRVPESSVSVYEGVGVGFESFRMGSVFTLPLFLLTLIV